jgi:hypothetical protein
VFFFEKKNQKTFAYGPLPVIQTGGTGAARNSQKFFASFFQKRSPSFRRTPSYLTDRTGRSAPAP